MPHRSIKDVLIFLSTSENKEVPDIFYFVFPFDTNPQSGMICKCIRATRHETKIEFVFGSWCQPISNPFLGERINYVDPRLPDECARQIKLALFEYNRHEQPYRKRPI